MVPDMLAFALRTVGGVVSRITVKVAAPEVTPVVGFAGLVTLARIRWLFSVYGIGPIVKVTLFAPEMSAPLSVHWNENGAVPSTTTLKFVEPRSLTVALAGLVRIAGATAAPCSTVLILRLATSCSQYSPPERAD